MKLQIFLFGVLVAINLYGVVFGCMSPRSTPISRSASPELALNDSVNYTYIKPKNLEENIQRLSHLDDVYDVVYTAATSACIGEEFSYDEALSLAELILYTDKNHNWNFDFSLESLDIIPASKESEEELNENLRRFSDMLNSAIAELKNKI